jgi:hypothetical protein
MLEYSKKARSPDYAGRADHEQTGLKQGRKKGERAGNSLTGIA